MRIMDDHPASRRARPLRTHCSRLFSSWKIVSRIGSRNLLRGQLPNVHKKRDRSLKANSLWRGNMLGKVWAKKSSSGIFCKRVCDWVSNNKKNRMKIVFKKTSQGVQEFSRIQQLSWPKSLIQRSFDNSQKMHNQSWKICSAMAEEFFLNEPESVNLAGQRWSVPCGVPEEEENSFRTSSAF